MKRVKIISYLVIFSFFLSVEIFGQAKKPTLMVLPLKNWCVKNGYTVATMEMGKEKIIEDYQAVVDKSSDFNNTVAVIDELMANENFPLEVLQQALAAQGFEGGSRGATEWNQWVQAEKEVLAQVMERYGFEWEQKGTHEQHLSVLDYKKQERSKELAATEERLTEAKADLQSVEKRIQSYEAGEVDLMNKTYREKLGLPVIEKLKKIIKELLVRYSRAMDKLIKLAQQNSELYKDNQFLEEENKHLREENGILRNQNKEYSLLRKVFGKGQIETWLRQAKEVQQIKKERSRMHGWER